jgi:S-adenosylmethionine synthetase
MFGGAVGGEAVEYMPLPIMLAHGLTRRYTQLFESGQHPYLRPDGKAQVVVEYHQGIPRRVVHITLAVSHAPTIRLTQLRRFLHEAVIEPVLLESGLVVPANDQIVINGGGEWFIPGPLSDAGTTGRKIIVDSYGGAFPHGGGNYNGKDPTKVDVSGAVAARYLAKELVARQLATKVQVDVCYALGIPDPLGLTIETFGTASVSESELYHKAEDIIDLSVDGIMQTIDLYQPIYAQAASGGWFGRREFPWEQTSL